MDARLDRNFGFVIAYVLPGLMCLVGISFHSPMVSAWLTRTPSDDLTIGTFFYVILGSLTCGMLVSAIRWALIDSLHHATGLPYPDFDFSRLPDRLEAFQLAVEHYYRYYQFHSNMAVALVIYAVLDQVQHGIWSWQWMILGVGLIALLLITSRNNLSRYYDRGRQLLAADPSVMTLNAEAVAQILPRIQGE